MEQFRSRQEVAADVALFGNLYDALKDEVDKYNTEGEQTWDIGLVRFCLENMGDIVGKSAPAMLDFLQRMGKRDMLTDEEMRDRTIALVPGEAVYRMLDEMGL